MYKNQLQELAQRSCFNLPWYSCIREGPDHAPRFKATVNFNGEVFESPNFCTTLRQAEHSAAEVALNSLSNKGPSHSLAARILDETGVYKNLLQEVSQRVGAALPQYTTVRSGLGHLPVFTCTVELAGIKFTGEPAKNKKQAEKNAAMAAWSSLKQLVKHDKTSSSSSSSCSEAEEQEQVIIARALLNYRLKSIKMAFPHASQQTPPQYPPPITSSKILPLIRPQKFLGVDAKPYIPIRHHGHGVAPPVTIRTAVPVFSAAPRGVPLLSSAPPVHVRQQQQQQQVRPMVSATTLDRVEEAPVVVVQLEEQESPAVASTDKLEEEPPPPPGPEILGGHESVGTAPPAVDVVEEPPTGVQEGVKELKI